MTRELFVHEAVLAMDEDGDLRAPGGAITLALCGDWEHEPPCPLAPHHTAAERNGELVYLRVLFAAEPGDEAEVRRRIVDALAGGEVQAPTGGLSRWSAVWTGPSTVRPGEYEHGRRLAAS